MKCWIFMLTLTFGTTRTAELSALGASCSLPHMKLLCTYFCQRLSGSQGYWMRALENSKTPYRESNSEPSVMLSSASTNCATHLPVRPPTSSSIPQNEKGIHQTTQSRVLVLRRNIRRCTECESTLLCAQHPVSWSYPEPTEPNAHHYKSLF